MSNQVSARHSLAGLLIGRRCLWLAGVVCEPDTGANSAVGATAAQTQAVPPAQTQAAPVPGIGDSAQFLSALGQAIGQSVASALTPVQQGIQQQNTQINETLQSLSAPAHNRQSALFGGGAPGIRQGENPMSSRGYEFCRAYALRQGQLTPDQCKVEMDVSNRLRKEFVTQGGMRLEHDGSILVPLGANLFPSEVDASFRQEVAEMTRQSVIGCDPGQLRYLRQRYQMNGGVQQALASYDESGLGVFTGPATMGEFIDLLRNKEVFTRAGATDFALPANGHLLMPRLTGASTAYWVGETPSNASTSALTASAPTSGAIQMSAKKLAVLVKYPNELVRFGGPTIEALLRGDMSQVMALKADATMLDGVGTTVSPKGLLNYSINSITAGTVATDGNTLAPEDLGLMINKLEEDNIDVESDGFTWLMRSWLHWQILNRRVTEYSGGTNGEWLFSTNRADANNGMPMRLLGFPSVKSNQIPNTRTKGSGTYGSCLIGGCFKHWLIGRVGVMEFTTTTSGDTSFVTDQTWMKVIQHMDAQPRHEEAFVYCDNLV